MMKAELSGELVRLDVSYGEYHVIMASLRELVAEMHEQDFPSRVGSDRDTVSELAQSFFDESVRLGIEE